MNAKRVLNNGRNLRDSKNIINFLTCQGYRTPQYIWVGYSNSDIEFYDTTKKGLLSKLDRDNRLF